MKPLLPLLGALLLAGCASAPNTLILAPSAPMVQAGSQQGALALTSVDHRPEQFLVEVRKDDGAAELLSPAEPPRQLLEQGIRDGLSRLGYRIDPAATVTLSLSLDKLVMKIDQGTFGHDASTSLIATVIVDNRGRTLTKEYRVRSSFSGPLKPEMARIEREMNDRLSQLMSDIVNDPELHTHLNLE
ncbi:YajG family lipoprotein [Ferrimonas sediminicola]|nr:YajG family lipoprotein [Ferrimonas sediminicola]